MRDITLVLKRGLSPANGKLSQQLAEQLREAISAGELKPGDRIPASRQLARELTLARGTITTAIEMLLAEGFLEARIGSGTYVSEAARRTEHSSQRQNPSTLELPDFSFEPDVDLPAATKIDFRPCRPSLEAFPLQAWRRCLSLAGSATPSPDYGDPLGHSQLRGVISDYLRRARGLTASAEEIIITNGSVHAMHLLSAIYLDKGSRVIVENPGYPLAWQTFQLAGAEIISCGVDEEGLCLDHLPQKPTRVKFVYVTPSHQFPTGSRLSLARRQALIGWADKHDILIIEDDYDGEYRYDVPPLAPMASMDTHRVVYCGTFSKTMFPGLRIGFAVAPEPLIRLMAKMRTLTEYAPCTPTQVALSNFISTGHFERHIHKMRRIYRHKRMALVATLADLGIDAQVSGLDSGLSAMVRLGGKRSGSYYSNRAKKAGILAPSVLRYGFGAPIADNALIIGYAQPTTEQIVSGLEFLL
jgi:GntR family transcriptional regulator/MocR family aminotransferase